MGGRSSRPPPGRGGANVGFHGDSFSFVLDAGTGKGAALTPGHDPQQSIIRDASVGRRYDISTIQRPLGHKDANMTMIYTYVLNKGATVSGAQSIYSERSYTLCIRPAFGCRFLLCG